MEFEKGVVGVSSKSNNNNNNNTGVEEIAKAAKGASRRFGALPVEVKNALVGGIVCALVDYRDELFTANQKDLKLAEEGGKESAALLKRLDLFGEPTGPDGSYPKWDALLSGLDDIINMPDPIGKRQLHRKLDDDLILERLTCPIGSILIVFEARPEVVVQIASLCLKSSNAVILKGGKEAYHSNIALVSLIQRSLLRTASQILDPEACKGIENMVQYVHERGEIAHLLKLNTYIDLVIPRGSKNLVQYVQENAKGIPVLGHADGICSIYIDESLGSDESDNSFIEKIVCPVIVDAKTNYPAACNAVEMVLVNRKIAHRVLPKLVVALANANVIMHIESTLLDSITSKEQEEAEENIKEFDKSKHFFHEFLAKEITIYPVDDMPEAINLIRENGSGHTDCILTKDEKRANEFMAQVDSAGVYWNCSTRFADGYRYGFGAEIGVSTNRTHARGPVGMEGLVIYKYLLKGNGNIVDDYNRERKKFKHLDI